MSGWTDALRTRYDAILPQGPEAVKRVALIAGLVAGLVAALICIATNLFVVEAVKTDVASQVQKATIKASQRNCLSQRASRENANRTLFALRELLRFDTDLLSSSAKNPHQTAEQKRSLQTFLALERARLLADYKAAKPTIPGLQPIQSYADLFPLLASVKPLNCATNLLTQ